MTPHVPSFQTVVGPFLWRMGMVTRPDGRGRAMEQHVAAVNRARLERDDLEILEILTTIHRCLR